MWIFLFIISLTSCDKEIFMNSLSALDAYVFVRSSNIACTSARFFQSPINLMALSSLGLNKGNVSLLSLSYCSNYINANFK